MTMLEVAPTSCTVESVSEEIQARRVAKVLLRGLVWTCVVVALYCSTNTQRDAWELLWVAAAVLVGSISLDHLCRYVLNTPRRS